MTNHVKQMLERAMGKYNPEFDVPQGNQPEVSWIELYLVEAVLELSAELDELKRQIKSDKVRQADYEDFVDTRRRQTPAEFYNE